MNSCLIHPDTDLELLKEFTGISIATNLDRDSELRKITTLEHVEMIGVPLTAIHIPEIHFITKLSYHYAGVCAKHDIAKVVREFPCLESLYISMMVPNSDCTEIANAIKYNTSLRRVAFGSGCPYQLIESVLGKRNISDVTIMTPLVPRAADIVRDMVDVVTLKIEHSDCLDDPIVDLVSKSTKLRVLMATCNGRGGAIKILSAIRDTLEVLFLYTGLHEEMRDVVISDMVYNSNLKVFSAGHISINARAVNALTARNLKEIRKKDRYSFPPDVEVHLI